MENNFDHRTVRSYVRRSGRITSAQARAITTHWSRFGLEPESPVDLDAAFGRRAARVLEIGFGMGDALIALATREPERDFVGIEVYEPGIGRVLNRCAALGLDNIRVLRGDAAPILATRLSPGAFESVLVYFPDPWPKKRHHKRRLVQGAFVARVWGVLAHRGQFHLATDWEDYARFMMEAIEKQGGFRNLAGAGRFSTRPQRRPGTKFESRGRSLGHRVFDLAFERVGRPGASHA